MQSKVFTIVAIVEAQPGKEAELKEALVAVVEPSRAEKSCLEYRLHQDQSNPAKFFFYENWASREEHQDQFKKPYILELAAKLPNLLAAPMQVIFANEIR